jgi:hypothetical protein
MQYVYNSQYFRMRIGTDWRTRLVTQPRADVVWEAATKLWSCCGQDQEKNAACANATTDHFTAPDPALLIQYWPQLQVSSSSISTSKSTSSRGTRTSTTSTTDSTATAASAGASHASSSTGTASPAPSGLSPGAAGGIGAGVAVAVIALIGLAIFFILRRRKGSRASAVPPLAADNHSFKEEARPYSLPPGTSSTHGFYQPSEPSQIGTPAEPAELPGEQPVNVRTPEARASVTHPLHMQELAGTELPHSTQPSPTTSPPNHPNSLVPGYRPYRPS